METHQLQKHKYHTFIILFTVIENNSKKIYLIKCIIYTILSHINVFRSIARDRLALRIHSVHLHGILILNRIQGVPIVS